MDFRLTKEERNYIISEYGGNARVISIVENKINALEIITDKEDYICLVIAVISQFETIKNIVDLQPNKTERKKHFMNINQIIYYEIIRKYLDFDKFQKGTEEKVKKILELQ